MPNSSRPIARSSPRHAPAKAGSLRLLRRRRCAQGKHGGYVDFVGDTVQAFRDAGLEYYNEAILITACGSLAIRAGKQFSASRKLGKTHQNVLVFLKGDAKRAVAALGKVDVSECLKAAEAELEPRGNDPWPRSPRKKRPRAEEAAKAAKKGRCAKRRRKLPKPKKRPRKSTSAAPPRAKARSRPMAARSAIRRMSRPPSNRKIAETHAAVGTPHWAIAAEMGISEDTLERHYRRELELGLIA
jgi:hypothetical protein